MSSTITRRETLKRGLAASSLLAFLPELPALAQGETDVPFTDYPADYKSNSNPNAANRFLDIRNIDGQITPNDQFFFIQHYNRPEIDASAYRLKLTGLVNKPTELTVADLKAMKPIELVNGYECSGNSGRFFQGLSSCGRFTGVPLNQVLKRAGVGSAAREVVFFGTDRGKEDVVFRAGHLQARAAVWPQHHAGTRAEAGAAAGLRPKRPAADARPGLPDPPDHAGLVRCFEREVAVGNSSARGSLSGELPGPLVSVTCAAWAGRAKIPIRRRSGWKPK